MKIDRHHPLCIVVVDVDSLDCEKMYDERVVSTSDSRNGYCCKVLVSHSWLAVEAQVLLRMDHDDAGVATVSGLVGWQYTASMSCLVADESDSDTTRPCHSSPPRVTSFLVP